MQPGTDERIVSSPLMEQNKVASREILVGGG